MSYMTPCHSFLTRKTTISEKNSFMTLFFYSVRTFARIRKHYFSKYWGYGSGASIPPETMMHFPPSFRFHPYFWDIFRLCRKFSKFYLFTKICFHFHPPKFLMTFFSHRPCFSDMCVKCHIWHIYDPFFTRKIPIISENNSLMTPVFLLCSYFRAHPTTLLLKIMRGRMHGQSPHLKFWEGPSPSPPKSPPMFICIG